jgi:hypothetical protein
MRQARVCDECGVALPIHAPEGLCPKCLLRLGATELGVEMKETGNRPTEDSSQRSEVKGQKSDGGIPNSPLVTHHSSLPTPFGDYELVEKIGQGGMGVVYKARQVSLGRLVALKLLPFGPFSRDDAVQRFRAEAAAAAALQHPNIVAIHEVGEQQGQHYFAMDFIEGRTLAQIISDFGFRALRPLVEDERRGGALRPSAGYHPSRPQTVEHPDRPKRPAANHRLRLGQAPV